MTEYHSSLKKKLQIFYLLKSSLFNNPLFYKIRLLISFTFLILTIAINSFIPIHFKKIIENISKYDSLYLILFTVTGYGVLWAVSNTLTQLREIIAYKPIERSINNFSFRVFSHLLSLSHDFYLSQRLGSIISSLERAQSGLAKIIWGIIFFVFPLISEIFIAIFVLTNNCNFLITITLTLTILVYIAFTIYTSKPSTSKAREANKFQSYAASVVMDTLLNFETVKLFVGEEFEKEKYKKILSQKELICSKGREAMQWVRLGQNLIIAIGFIVCLIISSFLLARKQLGIGELVLINAYFIQFSIPLNHLGVFVKNIKEGIIAIELVNDWLNITPTIHEPTTPLKGIHDFKSIKFLNISFGYSQRELIIKDFSLEINPAEFLVILGKSGSGKSTLCKLLLRFYNPLNGQIFINDVDISKISPQNIRKQIAVVPQDLMLFNMSIKDNISYGIKDVSFEDIQSATKKSQLHNYIMSLPEQYDTIIGERGVKLSGGEKQRIAIARAILKNPSVLILDESTSALDSNTENLIIKNIRENFKEKIVIMITHKLSDIISKDKVIIFNEDDDKITEFSKRGVLRNF